MSPTGCDIHKHAHECARVGIGQRRVIYISILGLYPETLPDRLWLLSSAANGGNRGLPGQCWRPVMLLLPVSLIHVAEA